jgi:hypothetical protein
MEASDLQSWFLWQTTFDSFLSMSQTFLNRTNEDKQDGMVTEAAEARLRSSTTMSIETLH